jgi:thioredoxin 1
MDMSGKVGEVGDQSFETEVLNSAVPVLVDFWAAWCAPCRMLAPAVEAVAEKYEGKAKVLKLNVDENMATAGKYNIRGIPTLLLFKDGVIKEQIVGNTTKDTISKMIDNHL